MVRFSEILGKKEKTKPQSQPSQNLRDGIRYINLRILHSRLIGGTGNLPNVRKPGTHLKGGESVRSADNFDPF